MVKKHNRKIKNSDLKNHIDFNNGHIYLLTFPGPKFKKYVGQAKCFTTSGKDKYGVTIIKRYGYTKRWNAHKTEAREHRNYCRLLDRAIRHYGEKFVKVELIETVSLAILNEREAYFIKEHNTMTPNGYNLTTGGDSCKMSDETKAKKSVSMMGKNKGRIMKKEKKRKNEEDKNIPRYIRKVYEERFTKVGEKYIKQGYRTHCPGRTDKGFYANQYTMEEKLNMAKKYIETGKIEKEKTVTELRRYCKENNINGYSKKNIKELIELIKNSENLEEIDEENNLPIYKRTLIELKKYCSENKIKGYSKKSKSEIIKIIDEWKKKNGFLEKEDDIEEILEEEYEI